MKEGWKCPRCEAINAPDVRKCDCAPKATDAKPSMLEQFAKLAREENERAYRQRPVYIPYPVPTYPVPRSYPWGDIIYCSNTATTTNKLLLGGGE